MLNEQPTFTLHMPEQTQDNYLPEPPFRPEHMASSKPGSQAWQVLTGYRHPISADQLDRWINQGGSVTEPPSELKWYYRNRLINDKKLMNVLARELLHASWTGVTDRIRIAAVDTHALEEVVRSLDAFQATSGSGDQTHQVLTDNWGVAVITQLPSITVKERDGKGYVFKVEKTTQAGVVLFINASKLQAPADYLKLCDIIDEVDPEAGRELAIDLLAKLTPMAFNAQTWARIFKEQKLPEDAPEQLNQLHIFAQRTADDVSSATIRLAQRLANDPDTTSLESIEVILKRARELENPRYAKIDEDKKRKQVAGIVKRLAKRWSNPKLLPDQLQERIQTDLARLEPLILQGVDETHQLLSLIGSRITEGISIQWIMRALLERGQRILIQDMPLTEAMKTDYEKQKGEQPPEDWKFVNYLEWLKTESEQGKKLQQAKYELERATSQARESQQTPSTLSKEQKDLYLQKEKLVQEKIQEIVKQYEPRTSKNEFLPHPFEDDTRWQQVTNLISQTEDQAVKDKLLQTYEAKRAVALAQKNLTDTILSMVGDPNAGFPGGMRGWNKHKEELRIPLETSLIMQILFQESNCAGRLGFFGDMLQEAGVFDTSSLKGAATYKHYFMGGQDALGVARVIEPSGFASRSYFTTLFEGSGTGKVYGNQELIHWGLLTNWSMVGLLKNVSAYLDATRAIEARWQALMLTDKRDESLWHNWSISLKKSPQTKDSLDWLVSSARAAAIGQFYPWPHLHLLGDSNWIDDAIVVIENHSNSPLLPWIKLSLLQVERNLGTPGRDEEIVRRIRKELTQVNGADIVSVAELRRNLNKILDLLSEVSLPSRRELGGDPDDLTSVDPAELDHLDPNCFLSPKMTDDGNVVWHRPNGTMVVGQ